MKKKIENAATVVVFVTFAIFFLLLEGLGPYIREELVCDWCGWCLITALFADICLCVWGVFLYAESVSGEDAERRAV